MLFIHFVHDFAGGHLDLLIDLKDFCYNLIGQLVYLRMYVCLPGHLLVTYQVILKIHDCKQYVLFQAVHHSIAELNELGGIPLSRIVFDFLCGIIGHCAFLCVILCKLSFIHF